MSSKIVNNANPNRIQLAIFGINWPDPTKPFWLWFEILFGQCSLGLHWSENTTPKGNEYWSVGIILGVLDIRVTRDK